MKSIPVICERCGERTTADLASEWLMTLRNGEIVELVCPDCQTEEEHLASEVNDATTVLGVDVEGRLYLEAKGRSFTEAARENLRVLKQRLDATGRVTGSVVAAALRHGVEVAEVCELTGLAPEEVEKHRDRGV